tara:strand:+ start:3795 stop:4001 length:207 start_codon:yes stop_codon:yes gene_type:complete
MELDFQEIYDNYSELTPEEREVVRKFMNSDVRRIIGKVFGADFDAALGQFMKPLPEAQQKKGLAAKTI